MALVVLATLALLNPIRKTESPKKPRVLAVYDQEISVRKVSGGERSMTSVGTNTTDFGGQMGILSRWTAIKNGDEPGQLLIDLTSVHLWRKVERSAWFEYIPSAHTIDANRNKPISYELISDSFKCAERTAVKLRLEVYYEDGTMQHYFPWGNAGISDIWVSVKPGSTLDREMNVICAVELTTESSMHAVINTPSALDVDRILGTWHVNDGVQGRVSAGPLVISENQLTWTALDGQECTSEYQLASRSTGSTFPGGPPASAEPNNTYTTFVAELKGPHLLTCSQKISSFTISFASTQRDIANFTAFFFAPQAHGTMHRVLKSR